MHRVMAWRARLHYRDADADLTGEPLVGVLLLESGDRLLLEDGTHLTLEG